MSKSIVLDTPCGGCKKDVAANFKYCPWCGGKFAGNKCKSCGEKIEKGDKFCIKCGKKLE